MPRLQELRIPVLYVQGGRDLFVPWRRQRRAAQRTPGARFVLLKQAGHVPYLSHPKAFNALVRRFLDELHAGRPARSQPADQRPAVEEENVMADKKPESPTTRYGEEERVRHRTHGHGTHGAPTQKEVTPPDDGRDLPEGNGATGRPAAFPDKQI